MNDHDALLRAICENPREDTPRLAFADWLDENGQPERAAFIRNDIAMSLRDEWDAERIRWEGKSNKEYEAWGDFWWPKVFWHAIGFRRGLPGSLSVRDFKDFRTFAPGLFERVPIEHLEFRGSLPRLESLITEPWFPRITGLEWRMGRFSPETLKPILESPNSLTELAVADAALNPEGMYALILSPLFRRLICLRVSGAGPGLGRAMMDSLARPRPGCRLRSFLVDNATLSGASTRFAECLPSGLRILEMSSVRMNSNTAREFAEVANLSCVRSLTMRANNVGNIGATAIFTAPQLAGLKVLDLSYCMVGDEALRALLENSPLADGLNLLNLTGSPASADMKQAVKERMGDRVRL